MRKLILLGGLLLSGAVFAQNGWVEGVKIKNLRTADTGVVYFDVDGSPDGVCNYWGVRFKLATNTPGLQNMLSMMMAAQMANRPVEISYTVSQAPGTTSQNGCTEGNMAVAWSIGIP